METAAAHRRLTVMVPGLLGPWDGAAGPLVRGLSVPSLERLLSRADRAAATGGPLERLLFNAFGHEATGADLPVAAVTAAADLPRTERHSPAASAYEGWWMRADPVHLRADRDTLVLLGGDGLTVSEEEAVRLVAELDQVFSPRGWRLTAGAPGRWYLHSTHAPRLRTHPPAEALGKDIRPFMPQGEGAALWHVLMNEAQMQLNLSQVNRRREAAGALTVNSLWFWGGGRPPRLAGGWSAVWCEDTVGRGLALLAGVPCRPPPPDAARWLERAGAGDHLLVLDEPARALETRDAARWQAAVAELNERWLAPLLTALDRGGPDSVALITGSGTDYALTRAGARRWWRRTRPLVRFLASS